MTALVSIAVAVIISAAVSYATTCWIVDRNWRKVLRATSKAARRAYDLDLTESERAAKLDRDRRLR
jgi:hypothetical protein